MKNLSFIKKVFILFTFSFLFMLTACSNPAADYNPNYPGNGNQPGEPVNPPQEDLKKINLILNANENPAETETITFEIYENEPTRIPLSGFTKDGFYIAGWTDIINSDEVKYTATQLVSFEKETTLYVVWKSTEGLIKITYNFDNDTGKYLDQYCEPGVPFDMDIGFSDLENNVTYITNYWMNAAGDKQYFAGCTYTFTDPINLYASWANPKTYVKAYFHKNDGTDKTILRYYPTETVISGYSENISYEWKDHQLLGWSLNPESYQQFTTDIILFDISDRHYYAIWQNSEDYKITYYSSSNGINGNFETKDKKEFHYDKTQAKNAVIQENFYEVPEGKIFAGWSNMVLNDLITDERKLNISYIAGETVDLTFTRDLNLFPVFLSEEYANTKLKKLTFNANYEGCDDSFDVYVYIDFSSETIKCPECEYKREGYVFNGWSTSEKSTSGIKSGTMTIYSDSTYTTYYATWIKAVKVTYNKNDGSENPETKDVIVGYNDYFNLENNPFESPDENLFFTGWGSSKDSTIPLNPSSIRLTNDTEYYAIWQPMITVTFYSNYIKPGDTEFEKEVITVPKYSRVIIPTFKRENHKFKGFAKTSTSTAVVNASNIISVSQEEYYAVWDEYPYAKLYKNDGTNDYELVYAENYINLNKYIPVREGFGFVGWGTSANDKEPRYEYNDNYSLSNYGGNNLYAIWTDEKVKLNFYFVDKENKENKELVKSIDVIKYQKINIGNITSDIIYPEHFTINYWLSDNNYCYYQTSNPSFEKDTDLFSQWYEDINIIYYPNFETSQEPVKVYYDKGTHKLRKNTFEREGYGFAGWSSYEGENNSVYYSDEESSSISYSKTLYAVWRKNPKITFNINDGSDNPEVITKEVPYNQNYELPDDLFTREDYTFLGWSEKLYNRDSLDYVIGDKKQFTDDKTLYAIWAEDAEIVNVTIDYNYIPEGETESKKLVFKVKANNSFKISDEFWAIEREGYKPYSYLSTNPVYKSNTIARSGTVSKDTTYYVFWNKIVTITYHANNGIEDVLQEYESLEGEKHSIQSINPKKDGYSFKGWALTPDATKALYSYNSSFTLNNENVDLYAVYKKN